MYSYVLLLHLLGATVWTGGHLVLALVILPQALRIRSVTDLQRFESAYEKIGIPSLVVQIVTGVWLARLRVPDIPSWFDLTNADSRLILLKLVLLALTAAFAVDARIRLIPKLSSENLLALAFHIIPITVLAIAFVVAGVSFRGVSW